LPIIIAATEDKSWRVRLTLSKIFAEVFSLQKKKILQFLFYSYYSWLRLSEKK